MVAAAHADGVLVGELVRAALAESPPVGEHPLQVGDVVAAIAGGMVRDPVAASAAHSGLCQVS